MSYNIVQKIYMGNNLIHKRNASTNQYKYGSALEAIIEGRLIENDLDILYGMDLVEIQIDCFLKGPMYLVIIDKTNNKTIEDIEIGEFIKEIVKF